MSTAMAEKKIKLHEEAISKILVAVTDSETGAEAGDIEEYFEEEEEKEAEEEEEKKEEEEKEKRVEEKEEKKSSSSSTKPQQKLKHRMQQVVDYQIWELLKEGTHIFILLLVHQKV